MREAGQGNSPGHSGPSGDAATQVVRMRALLNRPLAEAQLAENTALVAAPVREPSGAVASILVFRVGEERLAIPADAAHRVLPLTPVRRVPHRTNDLIAGIANIGGELTLVARIGAALGIAPGARQTHFIVIGAKAERWAFAADEVEGVARVERAAMIAAPATVRHAADGCADLVVKVERQDSGSIDRAPRPGGIMPAGHRGPDSAMTAGIATVDSSGTQADLVTVLDARRLASRFAGGLR